MGHFVPGTLMNLRAKFDAASFILAGEIRNHRNKQTKKQTKQTVNNIHTLPIVWMINVYAKLLNVYKTFTGNVWLPILQKLTWQRIVNRRPSTLLHT